jgi:hypothetical protein
MSISDFALRTSRLAPSDLLADAEALADVVEGQALTPEPAHLRRALSTGRPWPSLRLLISGDPRAVIEWHYVCPHNSEEPRPID